MLTLAILKERWPNGNQHIPGLLEGIVATAPTVFATYGLTSPLLVAHAMAQFSTECGQGLEMAENLNYSAAGLLATFPKHFTPTLAAKAAHNPEMIGQIAYGGRMGNAPPPSSDGYVFRGAGLSQVTGRDGVATLQSTLAKHGATFNVLTSPSLILDPATTLECGIADWIACGCLPCAAKEDIVGETQKLNGGQNGIADRKRQLALWKAALGVPAITLPGKAAAPKMVQPDKRPKT